MRSNDILDHGEDIDVTHPAASSEAHDRPDAWPLLEEAIRYREQVIATYNGRRRAFCPHALGYKGDRSHVLVYQFVDERPPNKRRPETTGRTSARPGPSEGWRCLDVDRLKDVTLRSGPWHSAPNIYNPQSCLDDVRAVVQVFPTTISDAGQRTDTSSS